MKKVLVLDFGGQYNLLVARRVRECGVYCEIKSYRLSMADIRAFGPDALILTGGPATVFEPNAPMVDRALFEMGIPVLGICYGQQLIMQLLGGQFRKAETREYGKIQLTHTASPLFAGVPETSVCWMSHGVEVERIAPGFKVIATTDGCGFAAVENADRKLYGVQFHPEVTHTKQGQELLRRFVWLFVGARRCGRQPTSSKTRSHACVNAISATPNGMRNAVLPLLGRRDLLLRNARRSHPHPHGGTAYWIESSAIRRTTA